MWEPEDCKSTGKRNISCKIFFSKIRRFEEGSGSHLGGKKAPRGAKMSPKRPQIDIKIVIDFDAKIKRAGVGLGFRHWAETPPRELPGGAPGAQGRRPRHHGTSLNIHSNQRIEEFT